MVHGISDLIAEMLIILVVLLTDRQQTIYVFIEVVEGSFHNPLILTSVITP